MRYFRSFSLAMMAALALLIGCGGGGGGSTPAPAVAPSISTQPAALTVTAGAPASFSVVAAGTAPLAYQWRKDGTSLSGATAATLSIASTQASDAGAYTVVVSNAGGSVTSATAALTVNVPPAITTQPSSQSVTAGAAASFTVVATGTAPLTYQWKKDGTSISGATTATHSLASAQSADAGSYTVVVSNAVSTVTSSAAVLTVNVLPVITTQPASLTVNAGSSATFSVLASGTAPLTYQWKKNGAVLAGATSSTLAFTSAQATDAGSYTVVVTNVAGFATSSAATLTVNVAPTITSQPVSQSANQGGWVDFSVVATGTAPFTYQWKKDGVSISGATAATYRILNLQATHAGRYKVLVTNAVGSATSTEVALTLGLGITAPTRQLLQVTKSATISSTVTGGVAPLTFVWTKDGTAIPGATTRTLTIPFLRLTDQGSYQVRVTDGSGLVGTATSKLFVETTADLGSSLNPSSVAMSGSDLYLASPDQNVVYRVNGDTGVRVAIQAPGGPTTLAVDDAGHVWVTLYNAGSVGRIHKDTGDLTTYPVGNGPFGIAKGLNGTMWFSLKGDQQIGYISTSGGTGTHYSLGADASPAGLCVQGDGTVWVAEPGTHRIGRLAAGSSGVVEFACPHPLGSPQQVIATQDGQVYYTDLYDSVVVAFAASRQLNPDLGLQNAVAIPVDPQGGPMALLMDGSGQVWLSQRKLGKVTRLASGLISAAAQASKGGGRSGYQAYPGTASTSQSTSYSFPSSLSSPVGIATGPNGTIYAALSGTNQVAQVPTSATGIQVVINAREPHRVLRGESQTFTATVTGAGESAVTWEILEGLDGGSITQAGVYTAPMATGNFHIIARSAEDPSKFGRLQVVIFPWTEWPQGRVGILAGNVDGVGNMDGQGSGARFYNPSSVACDPFGNVFVADSSNNTVRKITPDGVVSTIAGSPGQSGSADGYGSATRFSALNAVATNGNGNIVVADRDKIRILGPDGLVTTLAGSAGSGASIDGPTSQAVFGFIMAVAVDAAGNIYAVDRENYTIRKVTPAGDVSTLAGGPGQSGYADGQGSAARFSSWMTGIALDSTGNVYVADDGNALVRKITPTGLVTTLAGVPGQNGRVDGTGSAVRISPWGIVVAPSGEILVTDLGSVRKISVTGEVSTLAEGFGAAGISLDSGGNIYVASDCSVRKIVPSGVVTIMAGLPGVSGYSNGSAGTALFGGPSGLAVDGSGNVFVSDGNAVIRKIAPDGAVSTYAGMIGRGDSQDGPADQARFNEPIGLALDGSGNLYVADVSDHTIRKISAAGIVSTLAGSPKAIGSTDGVGSAARFKFPQGVAVDGSGNVFVADSMNNSIRKITPAGEVSTFAGKSGEGGHIDGPAADARFGSPNALAIDKTGNLYVTDYWAASLRKITPEGVVSTVAGTEWMSNPLDGAPNVVGFNHARGVAVDADGNVYIADQDNSAIRKVLPGGFVGTLVGDYQMGVNRAGLMRDGSDMPLGSAYGAVAAPVGVALGPDGAIYITANNGVMKLGNNRTDPPPVNLAYRTNPVTYTKGEAITPNLPSNTGGNLVTYAVSPSLPPGLRLDLGTGIISGTPTALLTTAQDYTITGTAVGGQITVKLNITVNDQPPANLVYTRNTAAYTKGTTITPNAPHSTGGPVITYAISPSLPGGLAMDTTTGIISGTPTELTVAATYTVTATNTGGSASVDLTLGVNDVRPSNLAYPTNPGVYTKGAAISTNTPTCAGGPVVSYAVAPTLPIGLALDAATGAITGTPTAITSLATYTVTATNTGGSTTVALVLTVNDMAPANLAYATPTAIYVKGTAIASNGPTSTGGPVVSYTVSPTLPAGLALSGSTGILSGTPTAVAAQKTYTVTATNTGGSITASLDLTVNDIPPAITFGSGSFTFTTNTAITKLTPTNTGGAVITWAVAPTLPVGLAFGNSDGSISGTPTAITPAAAYTVTATNSGGTTTVMPNIRVNPPAPAIQTQPTDQAVAIGQTATFAVVATGTGTLSYQWSKNTTAITGATSGTLVTPAATLAEQGAKYGTDVTDTYGSVTTSTQATLTVIQGAFATGGSLGTARSAHAATLLASGKVLVTGGSDATGALATAELYDPATSTATATTGAMTLARTGHTATPLTGGKVLVVGGSGVTAELYDPTPGTFAATGSTLSARAGHTATPLADGKVLIVGGADLTTELYDPVAGTFSSGGTLTSARSGHTATLLANGKVLIAGGTSATCELFDPGPKTFTSTGVLAAPRAGHTATLIAGGKVLLTGGTSGVAEVYDVTLGTFSTAVVAGAARSSHTASLLTNGRVLLAGGLAAGTSLVSAEAFNPVGPAFLVTGSLATARDHHTATVLANGKVVIVGGRTGTAPVASVEVYDPQDPPAAGLAPR